MEEEEVARRADKEDDDMKLERVEREKEEETALEDVLFINARTALVCVGVVALVHTIRSLVGNAEAERAATILLLLPSNNWEEHWRKP